MEVETDSDEAEDVPPVTQQLRRPAAREAGRPTADSTAPGLDSGEWAVLHTPDEPTIRDDVLPSPKLVVRPLTFYVRVSADPTQRRTLCKITLPRSWGSATVGRLVEHLARRAALPEWDCHLTCGRGDIANALPCGAAIARKETVELARGPPRVAPNATSAGQRRSLWAWGRMADGSVEAQPRPHGGLGAHSIVQVALGDEHVAAATSVGLLLTWGRNDFGQVHACIITCMQHIHMATARGLLQLLQTIPPIL